MEIEDTSSHVSIGFPLGLALLVTLILFICCFFCCCLHWEKLQSLLLSYGLINPHTHIMQTHLPSSNDHKPPLPIEMKKQNSSRSMPVLMPGDEVPKFMAIACPCHPPTDQRITIHQQHQLVFPTAPN